VHSVYFLNIEHTVTHTLIARQRLGKHNHTLSTLGHPLLGNGPINTHSWQHKTVFSVESVPRNYKRAQSEDGKVTRVEAGLNTSTMTLRVVKGDEKGSLKSETVKYGLKSQGYSDPRKTALARASSTYKRQTGPLVREGAPQEQDRNCHTSNKDLIVSARWVLYSKTEWPTDPRS
jgi:hypothetical protein